MTRAGPRFTPTLPGAIFTGAGTWAATLAVRGFEFERSGGKTRRTPYVEILSANSAHGVVWAAVRIETKEGALTFDGLPNRAADALISALTSRISEALLQELDRHNKIIIGLASSAANLLARPKYLCRRDIALWADAQEANMGDVQEVITLARHPMLGQASPGDNRCESLQLLANLFNPSSDAVRVHNERFVAEEKRACKSFFDSVEAQPLTEEQRSAAIVLEDRNLLIAAAGSGKTSSVIGKIGYHLLRRFVRPHEIVVLAFNRSAAEELKSRIHLRLAALLNGETVRVETFHSLGLDIIAAVENAKPSVAEWAADGGGSGRKTMSDIVAELSDSDKAFVSAWALFHAVYAHPSKNPAAFTSVEEWETYIRDSASYEGGKYGFRTLNGEMVKSNGELAIANWLFMNGVDYEYERPYEFATADRNHRQYCPDFYFPGLDCYLEHWALDAKGRPPPAFAAKYLESMAWKQALHEQRSTKLIETVYADFASGDLFAKLEPELRRRGAKFRPRSSKEVLARLNETGKSHRDDFSGFLATFIKHTKSNQVSPAQLRAKAREHRERARATIFVEFFIKLWKKYESRLSAAKTIDFEDMVINAARYCDAGKFKHPYRLILVDEFQDMSKARADLILGLLKEAPDAKLFAVGDDWQSIYRFAGSDISIFTGFQDIFGPTAVNFLTQTFRSNQGIADVATKFVTANPAQIAKTVVALNPRAEKVVSIWKARDRHDGSYQLLASLNDIRGRSMQVRERSSVYLVGRYNHQLPSNFNALQERFANSLEIDFKTVHRAKGLEADYVVVLGVQGGRSGFPSLIADDPLLELVLPRPEEYPLGEERRLLYVALTRARHEVHLIGSNFKPSRFLEELEEMQDISSALRYPETEGITEDGQPVQVCPRCGKGRVKELNGKNGPFLGCTQFPACRYTKNLDGRRRPRIRR